MLILDYREQNRPAGRELISALRRYDIDTSLTELAFGDAMFSGNGEHGSPGEALIGIEHKRLSDLVNSMKDRRLSGHQLYGPDHRSGLLGSYDYVYIFVEGVWRPGPGGEIEELGTSGWKPFFASRDRYSVNYRQVAAFIHSLELRARTIESGEPIRVVRTQNPRETAAQYVALYKSFTEKTWAEHHAHDQIYTEVTQPKRAGLTQMKKVTVPWRMAAQIPGIDRRAEDIAAHFGTVRRMALAGLSDRLLALIDQYFVEHPKAAVKAWQAVRGIGKERAELAVRAFTEEDVTDAV